MAVIPRRSGRRAGAAVACAVTLVGLIGLGDTAFASPARHGGGGATSLVALTRAEPATSIEPSAKFTESCFDPNQAAACNSAALADIDLARHGEHLAKLILPSDFGTQGLRAQLATIANLERTARHLQPMPSQRPLNARALAGAEADVDPTGPADGTWGSNLATGYATPLAADFGWMYDDGVGSPNSACTSAGQAGCWGHRRNILAPWTGAQGSGEHVNGHGTVMLTQLFVKSH